MSFAYLFERFPSAVQTFCYREVIAMHALGMEPFVVSIRRPHDAPDLELPFKVHYLSDEETRPRVEVSFGVRMRTPSALRHRDRLRFEDAMELGPLLKALGIRHVHAHFGGIAARAAWWLRRIHGIRYSYTGHANDIFCESGAAVTNAMLAEDATFIATETDFAREWMVRTHPTASNRVFRVFNGIEIAPLVRSAESQPPRIVSVGRLVKKKGFPVLLRACALLRGRGAEFGCDIVGGGPLDATLRAMIAELRLDDCVVMHGPQSQSFVRALMEKARVFALAAQRESDGGSDNLPTVIMEAMAASLPVVSTKVAGISEMVDDGETGSLVAEQDPAAIADALAPFLSNATLATHFGARGYERAKEKFSIMNSTCALARLLSSHAGVLAPAAAIARGPALRCSFWRCWLKWFC
jgi:colanic acid/amylovoran biosynthesis glycosyltransferase